MENNHKIYGDVVGVPIPPIDSYTKSETNSLLDNKANKEDIKKSTTIDDNADDTTFPTTKAVKDYVDNLNSFEKEDFKPVNVIGGITPALSEGYYWSTNGLTTSQYTTRYTSFAELIDVISGCTYRIPKFAGVIAFYDDNSGNYEYINNGEVVDFEFTIPEGKSKIGVSCYNTVMNASSIKEIYRITPTEEELATLSMYSNNLKILPANLQDEETQIFIKDLCKTDSVFEADLDAFKPVNILEGLNVTETEQGYMWGSDGTIKSNQNTTKYVSLQSMIDVMSGHTYCINSFCGAVVLYDSNGKNGTTISTGKVKDFVFDVPEGKSKIGVSYIYAQISGVNAIYRTTITDEDLETLPIKNDNVSLTKENLKTDEIKSLLAPLKDKTIVNFGDSIFGMFSAPSDISTFLEERTGATVHNCGFGGCRMAKHTSAYYDPFSMYRLADAVVSGDFTLQEQALSNAVAAGQTGALVTKFPTTLETLKSIDFNKVDIVTIAYGTNDWQGGCPLDNENNSKDTDCVIGALRYSIEKILTAYPHLKVFICSPIYRCWNNTDGSLNYDSDNESSAVGGVLLTDIVDKEGNVAKEYHLPFIDNYYSLGINKINRLNYFTIADGTHPNEAGRKLIASHIAKELF